MAAADELRLLRDRWQTVAPSVLRQLLTDLVSASAPITSPFGAVHGRADLRGVPLTSSALLQAGRLSVGATAAEPPTGAGLATRWSGLDFSGSNLSQSNWVQHEISDCCFDDANLEFLRCWGVHVENCSFRRANLYFSQLGAPDKFWPNRSVWRSIDFSQADLRRVTAAVVLERITFNNAKFTGTDLGWSDLVDCRFRGIVQGLTLGKLPVLDAPAAWRLSELDMSQARLRGVEFQGVNLGAGDISITLPQDAEHWWLEDWQRFLERVADGIHALPEGDERVTAQIWIDYAKKWSGPQQVAGFIATWDVTRLGGQTLLDLLAHARN